MRRAHCLATLGGGLFLILHIYVGTVAYPGTARAMIVAVLMLEEVSIRFGNAAEAYAASTLYGLPMATLFVVHLAVAIPTFIVRCWLATLSWRAFTRTLPGPFGRTHRRWGRLAFLGLCLSSLTGTGLYVMGFAF